MPKVREALAVDWTDRTNLTSKVRRAIKQVLRARENKAIVQRLRAREGAAAGSGRNGMDPLVDRLFEQAQILYRRWPEVEGAYAPAPREEVSR